MHAGNHVSATGPALPSLTNPVVMRPLNAAGIQPAGGHSGRQQGSGQDGMLEHEDEPDNRPDLTGNPELDAELAELEAHTKARLLALQDHALGLRCKLSA